MWWKIGLVANAVVAIAYFGIAAAIIRPLLKSGQLRTNPLGAATAAIFLTCAVSHGGHSIHMLLPYWDVQEAQGRAMRAAWTWEAAVWDIVTAVVGLYYWTLRRTYAPLMRGAQLFEDMRQREQQALELNDNVLQGLVVAKMALELGQKERATTALESSIASASHMISDLLGAQPKRDGLLRTKPASIGEPR
jgi:hypothetical protein